MRLSPVTIFFCFVWSTALYAQVGLSAGELQLFNLVNQERKKAGLPQFEWNYHLAEGARAHAERMAQRNMLTHRFEDEAALGERLGVTGARFNGAAENVAQADISGDTVTTIHTSLMNSPEHRSNILSAKYNALGLAIVSRNGQMYVTQDFAHTLQAYTDEQFRAGVIAAVNKAREANGLSLLVLREDENIHGAACSEYEKPEIPQGLSGALDAVVFTSSEPEKLPANMQKPTHNPALHRMSVGTCFRPDGKHGYANFWVVAAFYP